jgi:hypothetical protein
MKPQPLAGPPSEDRGRHTNVLVRALVQNDPEQARAAAEVLKQAELVAVPLPV